MRFGHRPNRVTRERKIRSPWLAATCLAAMVGATVPLAAPVYAQAPGANAGLPPAAADPSPLATAPSTPAARLEAVTLMLDLGRLDLASSYFRQLMEGGLDDATLLSLRDQFGTGTFVRLGRVKELQPESRQLLDRLTDLARTRAADPAYVNQLIDDLLNEPTRRELAFRELRNVGASAVPLLLARAAAAADDPSVSTELLLIGILRVGDPAVEPLIAAAASDNSALQNAAIGALGLLRAQRSATALWGPAFAESSTASTRTSARTALSRLLYNSPNETARLQSADALMALRNEAEDMFFRRAPLEMVDGQARRWIWDRQAQELKTQLAPPDLVRLEIAAQRSRQALDLAPENRDLQALYLAALLGTQQLTTPADAALDAREGTPAFLAVSSGEDLTAEALQMSLQAGQTAAARAALAVLSETGTTAQLTNSGRPGNRRPLIGALYSPDPRIPFDAAIALLRLEPKGEFEGASQLVQVLVRALNTNGAPRALIIDADSVRASAAGGYLAAVGYEPVLTSTGQEGFRRAVSTQQIDVVVLHVNCIRWDLSQTLANFRADSRTAFLPLVVYGPDSARGKVAAQLRRFAPATYVSEASTPSDFQVQFQPFMDAHVSTALTDTERTAHRSLAIYWLAELTRTQPTLNLTAAVPGLAEAAEEEDLSPNALAALSGIGSIEAQGRITDIAVNRNLPESIRADAARALASHFHRYGVLLTQAGVRDLELNAAAERSPELKSLLAAALSALRPSDQAIGKRLRDYAPASLR